MKFKTGYENRKARVEMLPLIDVVFLLLVFFIYAMISMVLHHGLKVDLPVAGQSQLDSSEYINITITSDNKLFLNETPITIDALPAAVLTALSTKGKETPIYIEGDQAADLGIAITILDQLRNKGIEHVSFTCKKNSQP